MNKIPPFELGSLTKARCEKMIMVVVMVTVMMMVVVMMVLVVSPCTHVLPTDRLVC